MTPDTPARFASSLPRAASRRDRIGTRLVFAGTTFLIGVAVLLGGYLTLGSVGENYCLVWPSIDTRYAPGFSERKFTQVEAGMTRDQVVAIIGKPLHTHAYYRKHPAYKEPGDEVWSYTQDGAAPWGDWAWLSREVIFKDDRVTQKVFFVYYD